MAPGCSRLAGTAAAAAISVVISLANAQTIRVEMGGGGGGIGDILGAMMGGGMPMQQQMPPQATFPPGVSDKIEDSFSWLVNTEWKGKSGNLVFNRDGDLGGTLKACVHPRNGQALEGVCKWSANKNFVYINTPDTQRTSDKVLKFAVRGAAYDKALPAAERKAAKAKVDAHDEAALKSISLESTKIAARTGKPSLLEFVKIAGSSEEDSLLAEDAFMILDLVKPGQDVRDVTSAEIKKSYRKLSVKHHPDKGGDPLFFDKIRTSYEMLSDEDKRRYYLEGGALLVKNVETHTKELEGMVAQQMAQLDQQIPKNHPMRAQAEAQIKAQEKSKDQAKREIEQKLAQEEQTIEVPLTLEELFRGVESKSFDYERLVICRGCRSDSTLRDEEMCGTCGRCPPEVREIPKMQGPFMVGSKTVEIPSREKCKKVKQTITGINVPANADNGARLSVRGNMRGKVLSNQTPGRLPGPVKFVVKRLPDTQYRSLGNDLYTVLSISLLDALYGFKRQWRLFTDQAPVLLDRRNAVTPDNTVIKLQGKGMFSQYGGRGDLYVRINVRFPKTVPSDAKELEKPKADTEDESKEMELVAEQEIIKEDSGKLLKVWDRDMKESRKKKGGKKSSKEEL